MTLLETANRVRARGVDEDEVALLGPDHDRRGQLVAKDLVALRVLASESNRAPFGSGGGPTLCGC